MHRFSPLRLPRPALAAVAAALMAVLLSGCESMTFNLSKKIDYKSAGSAPALEVPPDLTTPNYDDRYQSATASGAVAARAAPRPSEVLPANPDARVARAGSERWLVVKASPEAAWTTLRDFWTKNGFVLAVEQPALGIMETDWAETRVDQPENFLQRFANKYVSFATDTYKRDKFRMHLSEQVGWELLIPQILRVCRAIQLLQKCKPYIVQMPAQVVKRRCLVYLKKVRHGSTCFAEQCLPTVP